MPDEQEKQQNKRPRLRRALTEEEKRINALKKTAAAKARNPWYRQGEDAKHGLPRNLVLEDTVSPETRIRKGPICGMPRRNGVYGEGPPGTKGVCCQPAGTGTIHLGRGPCWHHDGHGPSHDIKWMKEIAMENAIIYGAPRDVSPDVALMEEVRRTAGHVAWLQAQIHDFKSADQLIATSAVGITKSAMLRLYTEERKHLVLVCKVAIDSGIAERTVRLMEQQATLFAQALLAFVQDERLQLTPEQQINSREIIRDHLMALDAASTVVEPIEPGTSPPNQPEGWEDMEIVGDKPPGATLAPGTLTNKRIRRK